MQTVVLSVTSHQLHSNMAPAQTASTYGRVNLLTKSLQCYSHYRCHTDVKLSDTFTRSKQLCDDPCVVLDKIALMTLIFHNKRYSILWSSPIYSGMMFLKADTCLDHSRNWSEEFFLRYGNAQRIFNTANMFHQPNPQFTGQDM